MDFLSAVNCVGQLTKLPKKEVLSVMIVGLLQIYSLKISRLFAQNRFTLQPKSLFLIKSGENKALEALEKLIELKTKFAKTVYALQGSASLLRGV